jgi:hypothetical protein
MERPEACANSGINTAATATRNLPLANFRHPSNVRMKLYNQLAVRQLTIEFFFFFLGGGAERWARGAYVPRIGASLARARPCCRRPMHRREFVQLALGVATQARCLMAATGIDDVLRSGIARRKVAAVVAMASTVDYTRFMADDFTQRTGHPTAEDGREHGGQSDRVVHRRQDA